MYLGDGHISEMPRTFRLRIVLNRRQDAVIARVNSQWNLSIARRADVARLDRLFGWKPQLAFPFIVASAFRPR
jgi:hypothetical protein